VFRLISLVWRIAGGTIGNTRVIREKVQKLVQLMRPDLMNDLQRSTGIIGTQYGAYSASLSQASRFLQPGFTEGDHAKMLYKLQQSYAILHAFTFLVFDPPPMMEMGLYAGTASPQLPSAIIDLLMGIGNCASHIDREPSARARLRKASGHDAQCIVDGLQAVSVPPIEELGNINSYIGPYSSCRKQCPDFKGASVGLAGRCLRCRQHFASGLLVD